MKTLFSFLFIVNTCSAFSQADSVLDAKVDSLKKVITSAKHDSIIINAWKAWDDLIYTMDAELDLALNKKIDSLCSLSLLKPSGPKTRDFFLKAQAFSLNNIGTNMLSRGNYDMALDYFRKSIRIKKKTGDKPGLASSLGNIGVIYMQQGDHPKAISYLNRSLRVHEAIGDKKNIAFSLNNLGLIYMDQGNYARAIDHYTKSLKICEEIGSKQGMANALLNIGLIYENQGDFDKGLIYYTKSLNAFKAIGDKQGMANALINIGLFYEHQGNLVKGMEYHQQSLSIQEEIGDKYGISNSLNNIGLVYMYQGDYEKAMDYQIKSFSIRQELMDKQGMAHSLNNIGKIYAKKGNHVKAIHNMKRALAFAHEVSAEIEKDAAKSLYEIYKKIGKHYEALEMYELYTVTRSRIESEENQKAVIRQEYKYQYEKQAAKDSVANAKQQEIKNVEIAKHKAEIRAKRNQQILLFGGLGLVVIFSVFMFNRFRVTSRQKKEIEHQKHLVDEKQKEILDSIRYARRIQRALLPSEKFIEKSLQIKKN